MCISVFDAADSMEAKIRAGDAEGVCIDARVLKQCCLEARDVLYEAWTEEVQARVRAVFEEALDTLTKPDPAGAETCDDIAQFSWCRVYARYADLFQEDAKKYAPDAVCCPIIIQRFVKLASVGAG